MGTFNTKTTRVLSLLLLVFIPSCWATVSTRDDRKSYIIDWKGESWTLVPVNNSRVDSLRDVRDGVYSIELASVRPECDLGREFLGFNNRSCSEAVSMAKTAGPVMRTGQSASMMWREWLLRVEGDDNEKRVSLQAFVPPDYAEYTRCLGFVSNFYENPSYKGTCLVSSHAGDLFLNSSQGAGVDSPQMWKVKDGGDSSTSTFEMTAANKPEICRHVLAVKNCQSQPVLVGRRWILFHYQYGD
ncbi:hypothetical protein M9435_002120 [Picochlorum sp. BPE23]|nr:hypothetical protein M9435_002120 [Picochlorum sp. BPE23]